VKDITHYRFFKNLTALSFIDAIFLFGSRARGDGHDRSDIDLAIVCPQANGTDWLKVEAILDIENIDTLLKVDCVRYDTLKDDDFKHRIDKDKQILFERASHD
jgi:predicted nucleotidyltransferase